MFREVEDNGMHGTSARIDVVIPGTVTEIIISIRKSFLVDIPGLGITNVKHVLPLVVTNLALHVRVQENEFIRYKIWVIENESFVGLSADLIIVPYLIRVGTWFIVISADSVWCAILQVYSSAFGVISLGEVC